MSARASDAIVIGAGIMGASAAYQLARRKMSVRVLEREAGPALGSTGRSAAGVRVQFTTRHNILLSRYSIQRYRDFERRHGRDIGYRAIGYLLLAPEGRWASHMESVALQRRLGVPVEVVQPEDLAAFVPLNPAGLAGGTHGPRDGVIDPHLATQAWIRMGKDLGARYHFGREVRGIRRTRSDQAWEVSTSTGVFRSPIIVNCTGAWAGVVAKMAGLEVAVKPKRIQIFQSGAIRDERIYPLTIDLGSGVYLRSEGERILFGLDSHGEGGRFSEGVDWEWLEQVLITGVERFPWWEDMEIDRDGSWWGYYEVTPDHDPIIGFNPGANGWIDACGFSGHGIMHAPAAGAAVADLATLGESPEIDISAYGHDRFVNGAGVSEGAKERRAREENIF